MSTPFVVYDTVLFVALRTGVCQDSTVGLQAWGPEEGVLATDKYYDPHSLAIFPGPPVTYIAQLGIARSDGQSTALASSI